MAEPPTAPTVMPGMVPKPKPPTTPKTGSAGSSRASSAGSAVKGAKPTSVRTGSARKSTKKSKAKAKAVDADGKKVVDTSWKAKVTINLYNTHYPVCELNEICFLPTSFSHCIGIGLHADGECGYIAVFMLRGMVHGLLPLPYRQRCLL